MSFNKGNIAWVDCETSGLDANRHYLLEIAVIVTDAELNILDEVGFHAIRHFNKIKAQAIKEATTPYVQEMHTKTGLWDKLVTGTYIWEIDGDLVRYLKRFGEPNTMPVAGNSVRLDMNFMDAELPLTAAFLDYHMRDVSTVAGLASDWYNLPWFEKTSDHTAMTDIRESIRELKHYREAIFRPVSETPNYGLIDYTAERVATVANLKLQQVRAWYDKHTAEMAVTEGDEQFVALHAALSDLDEVFK